VTSQIWIAVSVSVLVASVKKRLNLDASRYTLRQILLVTLFEEICPCGKRFWLQPRSRTGQRLQPTESIRALTGHYRYFMAFAMREA
jgi:hypothetical protein